MFFIVIWIGLLALETTLRYKGLDNTLSFTFLGKATILIGILAVWFFYDYLLSKKDISKKKIYQLFQFTFFLFAFHEPALTVIKKVLYFLLGETELSSFVIYVLSPVITISLGLLVGYFFKKLLPKFYYVVTGGR